jgi:hypothetical protein
MRALPDACMSGLQDLKGGKDQFSEISRELKLAGRFLLVRDPGAGNNVALDERIVEEGGQWLYAVLHCTTVVALISKAPAGSFRLLLASHLHAPCRREGRRSMELTDVVLHTYRAQGHTAAGVGAARGDERPQQYARHLVHPGGAAGGRHHAGRPLLDAAARPGHHHRCRCAGVTAGGANRQTRSAPWRHKSAERCLCVGTTNAC